MGSDVADNDFAVAETPAHPVTVEAFYLDKTEVTNAQYLEFVKATGHAPPSTWKGGTYPAGQGDYPVTSVSWTDARAYAEWAQKGRSPLPVGERSWSVKGRLERVRLEDATAGRVDARWGEPVRHARHVRKRLGVV
jgi:formylglycine-generating enzyme required for sulfatase activity